MKTKQRRKALWIAVAGMLLIGAAVISLLVMAGSNEITLTAEAYADVIRFEAYGAGSLHIRIYDMAENVLWDSGQVNMDFVDWDRTNEWGERLANGYYVYFAQAWSNADQVVLSKTGKVVLLPGDQVQLQSAPVAGLPQSDINLPSVSSIQPMGLGDTGIFGTVGIGIDTPSYQLDINGKLRLRNPTGNAQLIYDVAEPANNAYAFMLYKDQGISKYGLVYRQSNGKFYLWDYQSNNYIWDYSAADQELYLLEGGVGNVGIGTTDPAARLTVQGTSGDLIAAYNSTNRVFVVENNGTVRADGTVYAADFQTGSADVAERINVSEWVEAGDVVEIDPDHPGFFRKSFSPYSTKVAGIISTSPGVILGNSSDPVSGEWDDNRPVLAITGRVPCNVSAENGSIEIGDLLVASSISGIAMKGNPEDSMGAVVGKAMEPLESGEGTIMVQVMLR